MSSTAPVALDAYAAKSCPVVTHWRHTDLTPAPITSAPSASAQQRMREGLDFEARVFAALGSSDVRVIGKEDPDPVASTLAQMSAGSRAIAGGALPAVNRRAGRPDLLLRRGSGYLPVDVKNHQILAKRSRKDLPAVVSSISGPGVDAVLTDQAADAGSWEKDAFQLAHYTRMLMDLGLHPGADHLVGGVVGNHDLTEHLGAEHGIAWIDLDSSGALAAYDLAFAERLAIAETAASGGCLVQPVHIDECDACAYSVWCRQRSQHPSFAFAAGRLRRTEWEVLHEHGVESLADLAALDVDEILRGPTRSSIRSVKAEEAVRRARMLTAVPPRNVELKDPGVVPVVPWADVEVDFDIEWDGDHVVQWGLRVRQGQDDGTALYHRDLLLLRPVDDSAESALASGFTRRLQSIVERADADGRSVVIFHWSSPEISKTRRFPETAALLEGRTFDLLQWWRHHFFTTHGNSLKTVAGHFGYRWQVEEPDGLLVGLKLAEMRARVPDALRVTDELADAALRESPNGASHPLAWLLLYNESDVEAQAKIRDGVRLGLEAGRWS